MAWELTIVHPNGHRLGSPKEVMATLLRAWPELEWVVVPSLVEQIQDQPDHPLHAALPTWSAETRRRAALPTTAGVLEGDAFSLEITGIDYDPVEDLYVDVRGTGDPGPMLMRIKTQCGWSLKEMATDIRLLDDRQLRERWDNFRRLRDDAKP